LSELAVAELASTLLPYAWGAFALLLLPLVALAVGKQIYPDVGMLLALCVAVVASLLLLIRTELALLAILVDVAIVLAGAVDLASLPGRRALRAERSLQRVASLGKPHEVALTISNQTQRVLRVGIRDDIPKAFEAQPDEFQVELQPLSRVTLPYQLRARRRGEFHLYAVYLRVISRWRFWKRIFSVPLADVIHVYPDMQQMSEYALLARTNRLSLMGVRRTRRIGQDNDFERLRDYSRDDNYRHIDWRSTARRQKLTVKDFQASQSQQIVFLVDCGRMMTNEADGLTLLDHALNAMLMLGYVALRQGDRVGLMTFSDHVHSFVPPRGGRRQMNHLLHASFNRFPKIVESRYDQAFLYLASHCRKRSLVVLMTNVLDEVNASQIHQYLGALVGRHLPLAVLLRDRRLFEAVDVEQPQGSTLYRAAAAAQILTWRRQVITDLGHQGVLSVDAFPEDLTAPLINEYLRIKAQHLL